MTDSRATITVFTSPIIPVDLIAAARRVRYRAAWVVLAILLFAGLFLDFAAATHDWWWDVRNREVLVRGLVPPQVLAASAARFFTTFTYVQVLAVLALTPAYAAGAIAQEKQRRNLELLLITDLDSAEIVFGRFVVRLVHMAALLAAGFPVQAIASMMGGVSFENLIVAYTLLFSLLVAMAGTCMLVSVFAQRVWDAVLGTYALAALVFFVLPGVISLVRNQVPVLAAFMNWIEPVFSANNPLHVLGGTWEHGAGPFSAVGRFARNMTLWGIGALAISIWQLRPSFVRQQLSLEQRGQRQAKARERPVVGDRPMLWREIHSVESGMRGRLAMTLFVLAVGVLAVVLTLSVWYGARIWVLPDVQAAGQLRQLLHTTLAALSTTLAIILLLAVSVRAAISIAMERDRGTLESLLISPLTGHEIAAGKLFAAFWGVRWAVFAMAISWLAGALAGVIAPVGPFVLAADFVVLTLFSAAIGLHYSILVPQPVTAVVYTIATWLMFCATYLIFMAGPAHLSRVMLVPLTPGFVYVLGSFENAPAWDRADAGAQAAWLWACAVWDSIFLAMALFFFRSAGRNFDVLIGRTIPIRPHGALPEPRPILLTEPHELRGV